MHALGLDVAGPALTAVVVDAKGHLVRRSASTGRPPGDLVAEAASGLTIAAIGVALETGSVELADMIPKGLPAPVVCTPGVAAVTAEAWIGAAAGARHAVTLVIEERVLAGILLDGKPWNGAHGLAGAAAWLALNPVERQDYRKFGSLAAEVSNKGIARRLSWRIQAGDHSAVLERAGDLESISASHVFAGARTGDGVSISVVRDTAKYIGMAIANLATAIDPEVVVLAGAIAEAGDLLLEPVRQEAHRRMPSGMIDRIRIEISPLGADAIAIGAARVALLARP
jgi:glucokinase